LQIKPKTSERVLCYVGLCLTGMPTMTQNPFIKVDLHESPIPSTHRGLFRYRRLLPGAWQTPSFIRYARPGVLCHGVWRPERQCHRRTSAGLVGDSDWPGLAQVCEVGRHVITPKTAQERIAVVYGVTSLRPERATPHRRLEGIGGWREHITLGTRCDA